MNIDLHGNRFEKFDAICRFRNILLMQLEMKDYMDRIDGLGFSVFSIALGTAFCGSVLWLYVIMTVVTI